MKTRRVYDGVKWIIYYVGIDDFINDLQGIGEFLDKVSSEGKVVAIVPNVGLTKTSIFLGTSFQGIKGLAIIIEKGS